MWPFAKLGSQVQEDGKPPAGVEDFVSFTDTPGAANTDAARWYSGKVPEYDDGYFPTVPEVDASQINWYRPPGDVNPQEWWDDKNREVQAQKELEHYTTQPWDIEQGEANPIAPHPNWEAPAVERATSGKSPSNYRFERAFDQAMEHQLNGVHMSMADNRRAYMLGGMEVHENWNNSYRIDPSTNDAQVFVGDSVTPSGKTSVATVNNVFVPTGSYRLGG